MAKHLRLIMLSLLAMIFLGGYAQTKSVVYNMGETPKRTAGDIEIGWSFTSKGSNDNQEPSRGYGWYKPNNVSITATMPKNTKVSVRSIIVNANTNNKKTTTTVEVKIDNTSIGGKSITKSGTNGDGNKDYVFNNSANTESNVIDFIINSPNSVWIKTITINYEGGSPTTTSFGANYDGKTFTFVDGVLEGWKAPTATHTPADVDGTITYTSDKETVATVDKNAQLTFTGYGTATITATFTPEDKKTYAGSTASYTITNIKSKYYATVADLRKDLNNGTLTANDEVAVKLTDAKVLYVNQWTSNKVDHTQYFVREGNAAISFYDTDINMSKSAVVNGTFMGKIGSLTGLLVLTKNNNTNPVGLQVKTSTKPAEPIEISTDDIANYVCDLVTVKGATVIGGTDCALFNGNNLMPLYYNKFFPRTTSLEAPYDNANVDLTSAIVLTYVNDKNDKKELVYELAPTDKYTLVYNLSEESVNTIAAKTDIAVSLKRTFYKDGEWNTLCLPFAVADAKTAFDNAELREVDTEKSNGNTIVFKEATAIEAGKPYLIKWVNSSAAAVNVEKKFEGVTLVAAATPVEVNNGGISFNGFYKMTEASELGASVAAIGAGNKLFKVTEGKMKGFRAAFVLPSGAEATKYKVVIDGTATGIEDLVIDGVKANGRVYNLNGQYVGNSLNGLQPGLYIQNGKKIVVK